jgi:ATP-binding cassette subfamily C protein CydC
MKGTLWRLVRICLPYWPRMALAILLGAATIGSSLGLLSASAFIIATAALHPSISELQVAIVGVRFFGITRGLFRYTERYVSHQTTFRLLARLRVWFYERLEPLAPACLLPYQSADLFARIISDIETLEQFFLRVLAPPVVAVLVSVLTVLLIAQFNPTLGWIILLGLAIVGALLPSLNLILSRPMGKRIVEARAILKMAITDTLQGVADLLLLGAEKRRLDSTTQLSGSLLGLQSRLGRREALSNSLSGLFIHLSLLALILYAIPLVSNDALTGVDLTVMTLIALASFEAVLPLSAAFQNLGKSLASAQRLFEIVDTEGEVLEPLSASPPPSRFDLRGEGISFRYQTDAPCALDDFSFRLREGGCLAIVGPSGAGKSTVINLLLRFWELRQGRILLGGRDLRQYLSSDVRSWMAVLSQHTWLFNGTIKENLLLAQPKAQEQNLDHATRTAQIYDFIQSLPQGYETWIGEAGLLLSAGERQRLAIARTLLKEAPILILDEPSAHLDAFTETALFEAMRPVMQERTTLIISHRLVAMDMADEILVLHRGQVIERGTHRELLRAQGYYRRMWDLQMQSDLIERMPLI